MEATARAGGPPGQELIHADLRGGKGNRVKASAVLAAGNPVGYLAACATGPGGRRGGVRSARPDRTRGGDRTSSVSLKTQAGARRGGHRPADHWPGEGRWWLLRSAPASAPSSAGFKDEGRLVTGVSCWKTSGELSRPAQGLAAGVGWHARRRPARYGLAGSASRRRPRRPAPGHPPG